MNTLGDVGEISITIHRESCNDYDSGLCDMNILVVGVGPVHITGLDNVHDSDSRASDLNIVIESGRKKVNDSVSRRPGQCEVNLIYYSGLLMSRLLISGHLDCRHLNYCRLSY